LMMIIFGLFDSNNNSITYILQTSISFQNFTCLILIYTNFCASFICFNNKSEIVIDIYRFVVPQRVKTGESHSDLRRAIKTENQTRSMEIRELYAGRSYRMHR
jgi:hypothetical protein